MKSLSSLLSTEETIGLTLFHQKHLNDYFRITLYAGGYVIFTTKADRISYQKQIIPILERPFQALSVSCSYDASMYVHFRYPW